MISTHAPHARCNRSLKPSQCPILYFYSRTSCEVQHFKTLLIYDIPLFLLTHLMRGATYSGENGIDTLIFLLTHLMRGATWFVLINRTGTIISTHAPHARCNDNPESRKSGHCNFYSRTSCEVQLTHTQWRLCTVYFYSRTSCEVQHYFCDTVPDFDDFYSRTSCEVQRCNAANNPNNAHFYSRTSCEVQL